MQRFISATLSAVTIASLVGCSGGGGSAFGGDANGAVSGIVTITSGSSGYPGIFLVSPTVPAGYVAGQPLNPIRLTAIGTTTGDMVIPNAMFTWSAYYAPMGTTYTFTTGTSTVTRPCGAPPTAPAPTVWFADSASATPPRGAYSPLQSSQTTSTVFVGATPGAPPPYCIIVLATAVANARSGSATVVVSDSP